MSPASRFLLCAVALLVAAPWGCTRRKAPAKPGVLTVSVEQQASWVRNFNPLVSAGGARWPTTGGVYEPLMIFNSVKGEYEPWLATGYAWSDDNREVTFDVRQGVRWSDGAAFSAEDVAHTFTLMKTFPAMDGGGVWKFLESVTAVSATQVRFRFSRVYVPGLQFVVNQSIVPKHIWSKLKDPVSFANENPVATGPFTEIDVFQNQVYQLGRNPHYWQEIEVQALRFPAYPSNDQANLALINGEVDWAGNFVPAIDRIFVGRNPEHHKYWFPLVGSTVFIYPNTTKAPYDDVRVRKALSMAVDRELVVKVAMYNYTVPADATGLSEAFDVWRDPKVAADRSWVDYKPEEAGRLLDEAGIKMGPDGVRVLPDGSPWTVDLIVVSGWSDWVRAAQVSARSLQGLGVKAQVKTYEFGAWFNKLQRGEFDLAVSWSVEGATPYNFYRWLLSAKTVKPVGEVSAGNWHRFADPETDRLLDAFEQTSDPARQRELIAAVERRFAEQAPAIPLFANPSWGAYNTTRFTNFPTAENPYAVLSPNKQPESLLVLTKLKVRPPTAPEAQP